MAVIKLLTGTTADYQAVENVLILDEREIAVEITTDEDNPTIKYFNIRQGDGVHTFFDLPIIVNNERMEKLNTVMASYYDEAADRRYFACIIQDATACCAQGIEFELAGELKYPDDYPSDGEAICVEGVFETYKEGELTYVTLRKARFL